ncbi:MAG TPA: hypothetical protein VNO54_01005, partial [Streptosporangiaceae bacterium]|nr:hypothetical protein [Streptosporangiaceae bacterium]
GIRCGGHSALGFAVPDQGEVVTATGEVVRASRHSHPDLYWALRGGGGNFGVVTEFEFRLHPVGTQALVAELSFPLDPARLALDALRGWRDLLLVAPREATFTASIGSDGMVVVGFVWVGDPGQGRRLLPALRALGRPSAERVLEPSYLELQRMSDTVQKHALRRYSKGHTTCASCRTGRWRRSWGGERRPAMAAAGIACRTSTSRPTAGRSRTCRNRTRRSATGMPWSSSAPGRAGLTRRRTTCG